MEDFKKMDMEDKNSICCIQVQHYRCGLSKKEAFKKLMERIERKEISSPIVTRNGPRILYLLQCRSITGNDHYIFF